MVGLKEKDKILAMIILLAFAIFLTYYFHAVIGTDIVFTHFFYIPIILGAMWWKRKGLAVVIFLVILLILSHIFVKKEAMNAEDDLRVLVFMVIAFLVVMLSERIAKGEEELQQSNEELEIRVEERTAELSKSNALLKKEIAERKQAEEAVREAEVRYRTLFEESPDGVMIIDPETTLPIMLNEAVCQQLGYSREELAQLSITDYEAAEAPQEMKVHLDKIFRKGEDNFETILRTRYGELRDFQVKMKAVELSGKSAFNVIFRDITESKKIEELRFENERLALASKAKTEFLATMSHELRTPLNSIIGFSELMTHNIAGELNQKQEHYIENILMSGKHLLGLINDILDLTSVEAGKMELVIEMVSVPETIHETLHLLKEKAVKHNVLLKTDLDPALRFIEADRQRFKQILFNLLHNAVKFSKEDGGIVTTAAKKEGDMAKISVSDNGIGISEDDMKRLFQKFMQFDSKISRKYGGTGLGLAITRQLVELHGGKMWAESTHGKGSTFTLLLPLKAKKQNLSE